MVAEHLHMISQYCTRVPFFISAVINRKDVLATTPAHSVTRNTKTNVNTLKNFLKVSNRLSSSDDPPVCGTGGSWKESHSFLSFWNPRELQFKKIHFIIPLPSTLQHFLSNIIHNWYYREYKCEMVLYIFSFRRLLNIHKSFFIV